MKKIELIKKFNFEEKTTKEKEVREIFKGAKRRLVEVKLGNNSVLSKHKAAEPITVFCLAGNGIFRAGENLGEEIELHAGTLITLEAEVPHEVAAEPDVYILVTKFM